jgi:hypothetical protein
MSARLTRKGVCYAPWPSQIRDSGGGGALESLTALVATVVLGGVVAHVNASTSTIMPKLSGEEGSAMANEYAKRCTETCDPWENQEVAFVGTLNLSISYNYP